MSNLSGKLLRVADQTEGFISEPGSVSIALCGYGSQVPRTNGGTIVNLEYTISPPDPLNAQWTAVVSGNDAIRPEGTYYVVTYRNANGDIAQIMAFVFADAQDYDLEFASPFDPNQPPPPIPPIITNLLLVVPYSGAPNFPGDTFTSWQITLEGDASPTFTNLVDGNLYTIIAIQDSGGEHKFDWPSNVFNATPVNPDPNSMTVQTFVAVSNDLYPIGAGTYFP
jgi:hypothetical protein